MSLATELKMQKIKQQKEAIEEGLQDRETCLEESYFGSFPTCEYKGIVYQEVIDYFKEKGITIEQVDTKYGIPIYEYFPTSLKIRIEEQKRFIINELQSAVKTKEEGVFYEHEGSVYPEVIHYFESEDIEVIPVEKEGELLGYVFLPRDVRISNEDWKKKSKKELYKRVFIIIVVLAWVLYLSI